MKNIISLLLLLLIAAPATADKPVAKIIGPSRGYPGDIIQLRYEGDASHVDWDVDASQVQVPVDIARKMLTDSIQIYRDAGFKVEEPEEDGPPVYFVINEKWLILSSYLGTYRVKQAVGNADGVSQVETKIVVTAAPDPVPVPVPVPPQPQPPSPTPVPVPPSPVPVDIATRITAAVRAVSVAKMEFGRVGEAYSLIADQIKSGFLASPSSVDLFTSILVTSAAGDHSAAWAAIDTNIVKPYVTSLGLTKAAAYESVWRVIAAAIKAGLTDIPPPPQPPTPQPPTPEPPAPQPAAELRVLMLYDDTKTIPAAQIGVLNSAPLMTWMDQNVGVGKWRIWPINVDASMEDASWREALTKRTGDGPCWLIISNGKRGLVEPLPSTIDEVKAQSIKYKP